MFAAATPWLGVGVVGIIICIGLAFRPAHVAGRTGHRVEGGRA